MIKNKLISLVLLVVVAVFLGIYGKNIWKSIRPASNLPTASESVSPESSASNSPTVRPSLNPIKTAIPTGKGPTFMDEKVPWDLLLGAASCELKGEIKFLNSQTYDNQDALFIYNGVDHPARNVHWTITPAEPNLQIGPNIFDKMPIPNGQSLIGVFPNGNLSAKKYQLTAVMEFGRLVDDKGKFVTAKGNVKVFYKPCTGKTTVVLP